MANQGAGRARERTHSLEKALKRERDLFRMILNIAQGLIVVLDVEGRVQIFNRACQQLFGYSEAEVKGRLLWECLVPEEEFEKRAERFRMLAHGQITGQVESVWYTRAQQPRLISWQTAILRDNDGAILGVIGIGVDITDKRRLEEERAALTLELAETNRELERRIVERTAQLLHSERLATLGALTAGILHEVRNPLVTLSGYHRLLRKSIDHLENSGDLGHITEIRARFETAEKAAVATGTALENMLAFARQDVPAAVFDARDAIADTTQLLSGPLSGVRTSVETVACRLPVRGRRAQLVQVLTNLLSNALDALWNRESPEVRLCSHVDGAWAIIEVADNGPGIPDHLRAQLFRPFFTTKLGQGTGLGLMISRHIIECMSGRLSYADAPCGGACFTVKLPLAPD